MLGSSKGDSLRTFTKNVPRPAIIIVDKIDIKNIGRMICGIP